MASININLFHTFPREYFNKARQVIYGKQELLAKVNRDNGKTNVFLSAYSFSDVTSRRVVLDKVFVDFDDQPYEDVCKVHDWCVAKDILHYILFSGRGYHLYIAVLPNIAYPKSALKRFHTHLEKQIGVNIDPTCKGDIRQIVRYPNTFNIKRKRFAIPIDESLITIGHTGIDTYAKKQRNINGFHGKQILDISKYDVEMSELEFDNEIMYNVTKKYQDLVEALADFSLSVPPCINSLLKNDIGHHKRFLLILWLKESGLTINETEEMLRVILNPTKYHHCVKEENQPYHVFSANYYFPECEQICQQLPCGECKRAHPVYK